MLLLLSKHIFCIYLYTNIVINNGLKCAVSECKTGCIGCGRSGCNTCDSSGNRQSGFYMNYTTQTCDGMFLYPWFLISTQKILQFGYHSNRDKKKF